MFYKQSVVWGGIIAGCVSCATPQLSSPPLPEFKEESTNLFTIVVPDSSAGSEPVASSTTEATQYAMTVFNPAQPEQVLHRFEWRFYDKTNDKGPRKLVIQKPDTGLHYRLVVSRISDNMNCSVDIDRDLDTSFPDVPSITLGERSAIDSGLVFESKDLSVLDPHPQPFHGRVLLPNGEPAAHFLVRFQSNGNLLEIRTNLQGYYVMPPYHEVLRDGNQVKLTVPILSEDVDFLPYEVTLKPDFARQYLCNETLSKHDIQLEARN